ncbi:Resolvase domain [Methylobacterium sp. 4-46]|uniref:recombinase family protein n=1 Tax=unclassified Methylobacterium TaxID=2615210 RepID=UPI000152D028|nr:MULTISPECIES: recombinase family protein [Methylobacterium]ACA15987.1 Resolvase domain [Methylobacterium sp. 4-46]WFT81701.1 recombinase family protein [Methylobacterium nodulans]
MAQGGFVAYYRVSTARQGASGLGLEAQKEAVRRYLNGGDWTIKAEFVEVESGRRSDRPELERALATARLHRIPLIVANVSRLTRSSAFLHRLLEAGVEVRFCDLPEIEGPTGRFLLQQMAAVAELEAGMIASRTKAALQAAKARGTKLGGDRGVVMPDATRAAGRAARTLKANGRAADLAPMIAELKAAGVTSLGAIARALNERGIPTARGGEWSSMQVSRALEKIKTLNAVQ